MIRQIGLCVTVALLLQGCTFRSGPSFRIHVDSASLPRLAPNGRATYAAYIVNIFGPGISPTVGSSSIGSYAPDCLGVGISSALVSTADLKDGVKLKIPSGSGRSVQVLGVVTYLTTPILGKEVTVLFEKGSVPELYELARVDNQNIFSDQVVTLATPASGATPVDVLSKCFADTSGKEINLADIKDVVLFTSTKNTGFSSLDRIQSVGFNKDTGEFTLRAYNDYTPSATMERLAVTPDNKRLFAWQENAGYNYFFEIKNPGEIRPIGYMTDLSATLYAREVAFTGDSRYAVGRTDNYLSFFEFTTEGTLRYNGRYETVSENFFVLGTRFYDLFRSTTHLTSKTGLLDGAGQLNANTPTVNLSPGFASHASNGRSVATKKGIYFAYQYDNDLHVVFYKYDGVDVIKSGIELIFAVPAGSYPDTVIAISPTQRNAYLLVRGNGILNFSLNADGGFETAVPPLLGEGTVRTLVVDPTGKYLITADATASTSTLTSHSLDATTGAIQPVGSVLTVGLAPELKSLVAVPLL